MNCKEISVVRTGPIFPGDWHRPTPGRITKLKFNYTTSREERRREIFWSFLGARIRKTSRKIASPIHENQDDRRETSPVRNDRNNLPLSFVSCLIQGLDYEKKKKRTEDTARISRQYRERWKSVFSTSAVQFVYRVFKKQRG